MKRSLVTTLIIGVAIAATVSALHASGLILRFELTAAKLVSDYASATRIVSAKWQYVSVLLLALGVAWLGLSNVPRKQTRLLILFLSFELFGLSWVCSLYQIFFQPLPSILAVVLAFTATEGWIAFLRRRPSHLARTLFANRLSKRELRHVSEGPIPFETHPRAYEVSIVASDIANKYRFAEDSEPADFADTMGKFIRGTADRFLEAGAYLQSADGEGVVAIFGFPDGNAEHAEKAVRVALDLIQDFRKQRQNNGEMFGNCEAHVGISSGAIIAAPLKDSGGPMLLISGEPVELARKFCAANHLYGSNILIGQRTFDLASKTIVARPIDFVRGVNSQDRHEIYEPLWLAAEAKPEHIARRDSFWSGVVLYREKRWAEAYTQFQKARGSEENDDAPLRFYLRRLEPLALQLMETPPD